MFVHRTDPNGYFIEDAFVDVNTKEGEPLPVDIVIEPCPEGFYLPRWDGTKWIEGKTTAEIVPILAAKALAVTSERNRVDINTYLKQAILDNKTFLALPTPTVAERNAQINKAARQLIRIERLLLNQLDSVE